MAPHHRSMSRRLKVLVASLALVGLAACSGAPKDEYVERPVDELYNTAQDLLEKQSYREAGRAFEEVERQHPYSQWAVRSQIMAAFSYYEANAYDEAVGAAERFLDLHPGHEDAAYAYYLIGVSHYEQISDVGRDQEMTEKSLQSFRELIRRYPDSDYARDARLKVDLGEDHLAGKQMEIARYYQRRDQFVAAINRFRTVIDRYQTTTHAPEALYRLTECYLALGVRDEAKSAAAVLGHNFPGSVWYERAYALLEGEEGKAAGGKSTIFGGLF